jgi:REP element-mobilizing transposase RayT
MPARNEEFQAGEYYHVYHRGAERQKIFLEMENYLYFLRRLNRYRRHFAMNVVAYCLMPNHFHFMLQPQKTGNLSDFMRRLQTSYVQAINRRYKRRGALFHERFRHKHVYSERYQILLCRYIHVNPLKDGLVENLPDWAFSNYLEFIDERRGQIFVPGFRERFFPTPAAYAEFVAAYGTEEDKELEKWLNVD